MYTERIIYLKPNLAFDHLVIRQQKLEEDGWLDLSDIHIPTIVILKRRVGILPAGTKLFLAYGREEDMTSFQAFGPQYGRLKCVVYHDISFMRPAELGLQAKHFSCINFDGDEPSENNYLTRYPTKYYARFHIPRSAYILGN